MRQMVIFGDKRLVMGINGFQRNDRIVSGYVEREEIHNGY
jgi:hypothetical protein